MLAPQDIITLLASHHVIAFAARRVVVTLSACDGVITRTAVQDIVIAFLVGIEGVAKDPVVARKAVDDIVPRATDEQVACLGAADVVITGPSVERYRLVRVRGVIEAFVPAIAGEYEGHSQPPSRSTCPAATTPCSAVNGRLSRGRRLISAFAPNLSDPRHNRKMTQRLGKRATAATTPRSAVNGRVSRRAGPERA